MSRDNIETVNDTKIDALIIEAMKREQLFPDEGMLVEEIENYVTRHGVNLVDFKTRFEALLESGTVKRGSPNRYKLQTK
jgi:hypothetical protein